MANSVKCINSDKVLDIVINIVLILLMILALYPIWFVLIASISNPSYIARGEVILFPKGLNINAYTKLLNTKSIWTGYRNSIFYTVVGTAINLFATLPSAYALSRPRLPGRSAFTFLFIFTMYFGGGLIPTYALLSQLHMLNTVWVMLLPGSVSVFNLIVARSFFESSVPEALFEAAKMDGSSYTRFFLFIVLPLSKAMIAVLVLFYALGHWNSFFNAMVYIQDRDLQPLQVIIKNITATLDSSITEMSDSSEMERLIEQQQLLKYSIVVVSIVPMLLLYPFIQRYFVGGIMIGAVKG